MSQVREELELFRNMLYQFMEKEIAPHYEDWEEAKITPREIWLKMGEAGLLLPDFPEEFGAAGTHFDVGNMIQQEMARSGYLGLACSYGIHSHIVAPYVNNLGTQEQKRHWLPKMVSGEAIGALAMSESDAGSDVAGLRTHAQKEGDEYLINGSKTFITNGVNADLVIVCAKTDVTAGAKGISLFLVDSALPGFARGKKIDKIGQHCSDTSELFFDSLRLPSSALLGQLNKGFMHLMDELPRERLGVAVQAIGHAQGAMALAVDYVKERKAFGQSISRFQNTRFKLAEVRTQVELCQALFDKYSEKFTRGQLSVADAAMLKMASTEMESSVVDICLQLFGGYGYTSEYPISRFYRDARVMSIYAGSSEIMREIVARDLLDS